MLVLSNNLFAQDTIVSSIGFKTVSVKEIDEEDLIRKIFDEKKIDYWEYRKGNNIDSTFEISFNGGSNASITDSIILSKIKLRAGFDRNHYDGPLPSETFDYLVFKVHDQYQYINELPALKEFLKPFDSLQKALYYLALNGFSIDYRNKSISYKVSTKFIELIMTSDSYEKFVQQPNGGVYYYPTYYIRIDKNGNIYKKKVGVLKYGPVRFIG